jgi:hypothetical protein
MSRFRLIGVALVAVFTMGVVAASAQAVPFWTIGGTRLEAGQTHNITDKQFTALELSTPETGVTISCPTLESIGVLLGSNEPEPGKNNDVAKFKGGCTVTGNGEKCKIKEPITTSPLKSELVENVLNKKEAGKQLLVEFFPENAEKVFATLEFEGEKCKIKSTKVTGSTAAEVLFDPDGDVVELGQTPEQATSWLFEFPAAGHAIHEVWLVTAGTGTVAKVGLTTFGDESEEIGTVLVLLANSKFESEEKLWSPLP